MPALAEPDTDALIARVFREAFAPPPDETVSEWADRHREIKTGASPGPWRTDRVPYMREIQDAAADPSVRTLTVMKGSQVAGTEGMNNILLWTIDRSPGFTMYVYPAKKKGAQQKKLRLDPAIRGCSVVLARLSPRKHDSTTEMVVFDRMSIVVRGTIEESDLETDPCRRVFVDELDRCSPRTTDLVEQRVKTYLSLGLSLIVYVGKPGLEDVGISRQYALSDQRVYQVPCPFCGVYHERKWARVRWRGIGRDGKETGDSRDLGPPENRSEFIARVKETACFKCPHRACRELIAAEFNHWQLMRGVWVPRGMHVAPLIPVRESANPLDRWEPGDVGELLGEPPRGDHRGYHVPEMISGLLANPYAPIAAAYVSKNGEIDRDWVNDHEGRGWSVGGKAPEVASMRRAIAPASDGGYRSGTIPAKVLALVAAVDVQASGTAYVEVRGIGAGNKERWLVWHQAVSIPPEKQGSLDALDEVLYRRKWVREDGTELRIVCRAVDSGDRTDEVYDYCRKRRHCYPVKGVGQSSRHTMTAMQSWTKLDRYPDGKPMPGGVQLLNVNSHRWKLAVLRKLGIMAGPLASETLTLDQIEDDGTPEDAKPEAGLWRFPEDVPNEYLEQLTAEDCVLSHGAWAWVVRKGRRGNHYFDCAVYLEALCKAMGLDALVRTAGAVKAAVPPPPPAPKRERGPTMRNGTMSMLNSRGGPEIRKNL